MKKTTLSALAAATALFASASVYAQRAQPFNPSVYAEIGYTHHNYKDWDGVDTLKFSPGAVSGVVGYKFTPNLSVEGMLGLGLGKDKVKIDGVDTGSDGKVKSTFGLFLRPSFDINESVELFGRVGWVRSKLEISNSVSSESGSDTDLAYGIGANFNLSKTSYIQTGWMQYLNKDGVKIDGLNISYGMRF